MRCPCCLSYHGRAGLCAQCLNLSERYNDNDGTFDPIETVQPMSNNTNSGCGLIITIVCVIALFFSGCVYQRATIKVTTATVSEKQVIPRKEGFSYLIFTDKGVLKNDDAMMSFKWNSSDVQNSIKVGGTYRFKTYGWRVPALSWYSNILEVTPVSAEQ